MSTTTAPLLQERSDAELLSAVRAGDLEAWGSLFERHADAARRLARQVAGPSEADDLVSDAFDKVLAVVRRGGGPDVAFRAYLLTAVRRLHVDRVRAVARVRPTDDLEPFDPGTPFRDTVVEGFEQGAAARAFATLPERWQAVLWHTEVEGQKPAEVAPLLGMTPNAVAALAYRAREGLRQAFLAAHAQEIEDDACRWTTAHLGGFVRGGLSRRDAGRVEDHLQGCRPCTAVHLELTEVNQGLGALLAPLLLGGGAAAYVAGATAAGSGTTGGAGLAVLLGRLRDAAVANAQTTVVAGVAATTVVAGGTLAIVRDGDPDRAAPTAGGTTSAPAVVPPSDAADDPDGAEQDARPAPRRRPAARVPAAEAPPAAVAAPPTSGPTPEPTTEPTTEPTAEPTAEPTPGPEPEPQPAPDPEPEPEPQVRAEVGTEVRPGLLLRRVTVQVTGLPPGATGVLEVSAEGRLLALAVDPRCAPTGPGTARCELVADAAGTAAYSLRARQLLTRSATLVLTVRVDGLEPATARVELVRGG